MHALRSIEGWKNKIVEKMKRVGKIKIVGRIKKVWKN